MARRTAPSATFFTTTALPPPKQEPVDGFHPSQTGNMLLAEMLWEDLATNRPGWLPPVNPNNALIEARFGDQGGY